MHCPACSESLQGSLLLKKLNGFELRLCPHCDLRYSSPMQHPGADWYEATPIYQEVEWNIPSFKKLMTRWEFQKFFECSFKKGAFVFDMGCGRGDFLALVKSRGFRGGGLDINGRLIAIAKQVYGLSGLHNKRFEDIATQDIGDQPDVITAFEVMEHLSDPNGFLQGCHRLLKEGGHIVLSVPCYHRWPHWVNNAVDYPPHHLTLWSEKALRRILQKNGFADILIRRKPLLITDVMYHIVRAIPGALNPTICSKALRAVCKLSSAFIQSFLRMHPRSGGFTLMGVATKTPT